MVLGRDIDRSRIAWWLVGLVLGGALILVVHSFIGTFVFGLFIYYATRPVYRRMQKHFDHPDIAVGLSLMLLALPALLLMAYTGAIALQEFNNVAQQAELTQYQETLGPYINASQIARNPQQVLTGENVGTARGVLGSVVRYLGFIGNLLIHVFLMLVVAFYLLRDDQKLSKWFRGRFGDDEGVLDTYLDEVDDDYHNIFFGNILNAVLTASIGAIMYNVIDLIAPTGLGIPYPSLIGLITGVASLIPIVGMKLVYFPVSAYLFADAALVGTETLWFPLLFFLVSLIIVDTIPDLVLRPYVSGKSLHVGMVMVAYILGPLLFGWYGIFLGPMLLVLIVQFIRIILPELLTREPIRPWAVEDDESDEDIVPEELEDDADEPTEKPDSPSDPSDTPSEGP